MSTHSPRKPSFPAEPSHLSVDAEMQESQIFIIDAEPGVINTLTHHLEAAGFSSVRGFENSCEAIETLRFVRPDIILTDNHLPGVSGRFLTKLIQTFDHLNDVPIIVTTSDTRPETAAAIQSNGTDVVLTKPVRPSILIAHVCKALERTKQHSARVDPKVTNKQRQSANISKRIMAKESQLRNLCRPHSGQ